MIRTIKTRLVIEIETTVDDELSNEETLKYMLDEDLTDLGYKVKFLEESASTKVEKL